MKFNIIMEKYNELLETGKSFIKDRNQNFSKKICAAAGLILLPGALVLQPLAARQMVDNQAVEQQAAVQAEEAQKAEPAAGETAGPGPSGADRGSAVSRGAAVDRDTVYLLARVIEGEAADEPYVGKVAVGAVILNRTQSSDFPRTIQGVVYEQDAFESVTNGQYHRPLSNESLNAAMDALNGQDPTGGALYFWNPVTATSPWVWSRPIVLTIGGHVFAR